jgi:hypothetical protein
MTPPPDNTQRSPEIYIHDPGGIRTRNSSRRSAADPRLRRPFSYFLFCGFLFLLFLRGFLSSFSILLYPSLLYNTHIHAFRVIFFSLYSLPVLLLPDCPGFCLFVLTVQHTQHKHLFSRRDSNPQPQQAIGSRPSP